jgi:hypothetical protein
MVLRKPSKIIDGSPGSQLPLMDHQLTSEAHRFIVGNMPGQASNDTNYDAVLAKVIALSARNGVEDLHAAGAFSDQQAPSLNRRLRGRVYELLIATRRRDPSRRRDPFTAYVDNLARGYTGSHATAALQGAIARAVDGFAAAEAIEPDTARQLREAATKAALTAYKTMNRLSRGRSKDEERDRSAAEFWLMSIPDYWEEPTLRPEFQKLLDVSAHDRSAR